ncbi:adenylyltransferase/sulfurtransferase [Anaerobacterium chartisolvens]|uniref:Adenylyltransferase/sulfurtransferase n=1 Tax=Anaerobacterium chartisolvens TaxID=1297424 RepID=A0A369BHT2_9FIRM|nr:HesA/MoeB/ThiF family protein [Anaerobacterium chartisolvens]RCX20128.1 adenylyltransferase/sulfurtransferase [Anaerobacterium chartisolvens]
MLNEEQVLRYSRQIILKEFGYESQQKLLKSKVLVVGAGGLGSPALYYLAAAGVGTIGIVDFDTVGISNLQRQIIHFTEDLGRKKTDSAEQKIKSLNADVKVIKHSVRLDAQNAEELIGDYDVVIDAVDNFRARYLISDLCYFMKKPLVEGAVLGFEGILMTIVPGATPCYRCLYPEPPRDGVVPSCGQAGILGPVAGVIGSMQALEAIKLIAGMGQTLSGRLMTFDGLEMKAREIEWRKKASCPLCGDNPVIHEPVEYDIKCKF